MPLNEAQSRALFPSLTQYLVRPALPSWSFWASFLLLITFFPCPADAQSVLYADKFPGQDAGARIVACMGALPATGGVCDARQLGGMQKSAAGFTVGTPNKPVELLLGAVELVISKPIYVQARSSIVGLPSAQGIGEYQGPTLIKAADGVNLPVVVEVVGGFAVLQDLTADGTRKANSQGGAAIRVSSAPRVSMCRVTAQNAPGDGIEIYSQKASESCCAKLQQIMSVDNGGSGLVIRKTGDIFVSLSEFEGNGDHGIEIDGGAGNRIEHSDIGGNRGDGIFLHGTRTLPASQNIILGNQFGNNYQADLAIAGWNGGPSSNGNLIASNEFVGGGLRDGGKYDSIRVTDSGDNVVANNAFFAGRNHHYRSCVHVSGDHQKADHINNNLCQAIEAGGDAGFMVTGNTIMNANQGRVQVR